MSYDIGTTDIIVPIKKRIFKTNRSNLIALWLFNELSGTTLVDYSGNGINGVYNPTFALNQDGLGDGSRSTLFSGTGFINISANLTALSALFNGDKGSFIIWDNVQPSTVWTDGLVHVPLWIGSDANNRVLIRKQVAAGQVQFLRVGSTLVSSVGVVIPQDSSVVSYGNTWDVVANQYKAYINGVQSGTTQPCLGNFVGALTNANTGVCALDNVGTQNWLGKMMVIAIWKDVLTPSQMSKVGKL